MTPACTDCGAEMQYVSGMWRCPWASLERWEQGKAAGVPVVTCEWPPEEREVVGWPGGWPFVSAGSYDLPT